MIRKPSRLTLNAPKNTRATTSRLIREFYSNDEELDRGCEWWRVLNAMMQTLIKAQAVENDQAIEKRVEQLEALMREANR